MDRAAGKQAEGSKGSMSWPHLHIVWLGHLVQQLKGFLLQHVVRVLQAVDDSQLMLRCILGVDAHNAGQAVYAHVLQIVAAALQECGDHFCSCSMRQASA